VNSRDLNPRSSKLRNTLALTIGTVAALCTGTAHSQSSTIQNPGFESRFSDWTDIDPSSISSVERSGSRSAKIGGSSGKVSQQIAVEPNTNYVLTAYIRGSGKLGVTIAGSDTSTNVSNSSSWKKADVAFNTGSQSQVTIFGSYNGSEGRFDDFSLLKGSSTGSSGGGTNDNGAACSGNGTLAVSSASDNGNDGNVAANAIDGNSSTRWSSRGDGRTLTLDLGQMAIVKDVAVQWFKGNQREAFFDLQTSLNNSNWTTVLAGGRSFRTSGLETYDVNNSEARYVRLVGNGNSSSAWNSVLEIEARGCVSDMTDPGNGDTGGDTGNPGGDTGNSSLDPNVPPSSNFELIDWNISVPVDEDGNGKADTIKEIPLSSGYEDNRFFYTASDGGMVFRVPIKGAKTSTNTSYTRSELREMLRRGDTQFKTKGVGKNNWVFGSAPSSDRSAAGGVDGILTGTLAVNHVSTTGSAAQVGRVIVAQIHANDDEPIRLYYRKLPNNSKGSIYFAHESRNAPNDIYFEMIGSRSKSQPNPSDGIELNEKFSYEIKVIGNSMTVKLMREGKPDLVETVNMNGSGYDEGGQYMYFKAGAYIQDNTGDDNDYAQVTYYALDNRH